MKNFIGFLLLLTFANVSAQSIPGYMGKRLTIGYSGDYMIAFAETSRGNDGIGMKHAHALNFEYTIRNRTNFCFQLRYFKTGISSIGSYYYGNSAVTYQSRDGRPLQLNSFNIGLGYKFFNKGLLAPVGKYIKPEILFLINKCSYERDRFLYYDGGQKYANIGTGEYTTFDLGLTYQIGRQRVIGDRIVIDSGLRLGVMASAFFSNVGSILFDSSGYSSSTFASRLDNAIMNRTFGHEFFNVHLGIGFLAF